PIFSSSSPILPLVLLLFESFAARPVWPEHGYQGVKPAGKSRHLPQMKAKGGGIGASAGPAGQLWAARVNGALTMSRSDAAPGGGRIFATPPADSPARPDRGRRPPNRGWKTARSAPGRSSAPRNAALRR